MADTPDDEADRTTETAPAKKAPSKRAPRKRATEKKAPAKRTSAPRAASARTSRATSAATTNDTDDTDDTDDTGSQQRGEGQQGGESRQRSSDGSSSSRTNTADLALAAAQQLVALTGKTFEGIVGLQRSDDGWDVEVEVVEMRRIPSTTDVIAVYRVSVDRGGDLLSYRRVHRYLRGQASEQR
ncbi:gas vesicle protein GvpO [Nocardioides panacihumi]|uniref:gas vesicle protein GvpO n=1 Tax=Nocardioides panacihumi TaxID=400774 RepID=UPI0031E0296B